MAEFDLNRVTFRQNFIRCGRDCKKCPHGPYWYIYWREGKVVKSKYIGKELTVEMKKVYDRKQKEKKKR